MYSNNILNFQESTTILNACTKKVWKLIESTTYIGFGLVEVYGRSAILGYLMSNPFPDIYIRYTGFGFVGFYGISNIVSYLMLNHFYIYIS